MKICGYTLAPNSIIGFKVFYYYGHNYEDFGIHSMKLVETSKMTVTLLFHGYKLELTHKFSEKQNKEKVEEKFTSELTKLMIGYEPVPINTITKDTHG